jgi:hypothetical protein
MFSKPFNVLSAKEGDFFSGNDVRACPDMHGKMIRSSGYRAVDRAAMDYI